MVKEMKRRLVERALRERKFVLKSQDGEHDKWVCPCGSEHLAMVPRHIDTSPGVVRDIIRSSPCQPKGWLQ